MVVSYDINMFRVLINLFLDFLLIVNVIIMGKKWIGIRNDTTNKRNKIAFWLFLMAIIYAFGHICETSASWLYFNGTENILRDVLSISFLLCFTIAYIPYSEFFHTMFNIDEYGNDVRLLYIMMMYFLVGSSVAILFKSFISPFMGIPSILMISSGPLTLFSYIPLMILLYKKSKNTRSNSIRWKMNIIGVSGIFFILSQFLFGLGGTIWYSDLYLGSISMNFTTIFFAIYIVLNIFGWSMPKSMRNRLDKKYEDSELEQYKKVVASTISNMSPDNRDNMIRALSSMETEEIEEEDEW